MLIKNIAMHDIPLDHIAVMERWYWREHGPEIVRRYGPWAARFESYLPPPLPVEALQFGHYNWRTTEGWWRDWPKPGAQGALAFTASPVPARVAVSLIPWQPDDDFRGAYIQPGEKQALRWLIMFKYPEGVSKQEGEHWFQTQFAPQLLQQPGLWRFFSYKTLQTKLEVPGTWPPGHELPPGYVAKGWDRVCELWYENLSDWRRDILESPPPYTPPPWATHKVFPFLKPGQDFVSTFLLERPTDEFLRDHRSYL